MLPKRVGSHTIEIDRFFPRRERISVGRPLKFERELAQRLSNNAPFFLVRKSTSADSVCEPIPGSIRFNPPTDSFSIINAHTCFAADRDSSNGG